MKLQLKFVWLTILKARLRGSKVRQYDLESDFDAVEHNLNV